LGAAVLTYAYDANEKLTEMKGFGPDGKPAETTEGFAHLKLTEDGTGNQTQRDYFDENGVLVLRWTPAKTCDIGQADKDLLKAECIIADASRTVLRSGQKKIVFVVSWINDNSLAMKAQIHVGDVLLENDGISTLLDISTLREFIGRFTSGPDHTRTLVLLRNGKQMSVEIPKGDIGATVGLTLSSE
jgi:hypothetical protein